MFSLCSLVPTLSTRKCTHVRSFAEKKKMRQPSRFSHESVDGSQFRFRFRRRCRVHRFILGPHSLSLSRVNPRDTGIDLYSCTCIRWITRSTQTKTHQTIKTKRKITHSTVLLSLFHSVVSHQQGRDSLQQPLGESRAELLRHVRRLTSETSPQLTPRCHTSLLATRPSFRRLHQTCRRSVNVVCMEIRRVI